MASRLAESGLGTLNILYSASYSGLRKTSGKNNQQISITEVHSHEVNKHEVCIHEVCNYKVHNELPVISLNLNAVQ